MEPTERISNMDALLFALSLEVAMLQMLVLEGCTDLRAKAWKLTTKQDKLQYHKLMRDRELVKDVMRKTLIGVAENGEWTTLQKVLDFLKQRSSSLLHRRQEQEQLRMSLDDMSREIILKQKVSENNLLHADNKIALLRDKINDDVLNANVRFCYAEKWLLARAESLDMKYEVPRPVLPRTDQEDRVHIELLKAYELQIKEREECLDYWQRRYSADIVNMNTRVAEKSEQLRAATNRRMELQKLYELHAGEMRAWLTFKRERAARLAREERLRASVTRIQAWWRGIMVRRALGAFRYLKNTKKQTTKAKKK